MRVLVVSWGIVYTLLQCLAVYYDVVLDEDLVYSAILYSVLMFLMCLVYTVVIIILNIQMNKLSKIFKSEKISINQQFAIFLFAYVLRFLENFFYLVTNDKFEGFWGAAFILYGNLFDHILPTTFVLYQHHKVFKEIEIMNRDKKQDSKR